jgi:hypothetical protein
MANDAAAGAPKLVEFRKSHPIDFSLLDQDDQAVMYISEDEGDWALHLTIANTSPQPITLTDGQDASSPENYHFALRFRPGTLSQRTLGLLASDRRTKVVAPDQGWALVKVVLPPAALTPADKAAPKAPTPSTPVTLYLRYTGADRTLAPNAGAGSAPNWWRALKLSGISAAPGSGARGTQVELIPNPARVKYASDQSEITGSRTQYVHVTNHSGRKYIPLHVGFVGGNQLLMGRKHKLLRLRLTNVLRNGERGNTAVTFRGPDSPTGEPQSVLVLAYDKGDAEWELGTSVGSVRAVSGGEGVDLQGAPNQQSARPEWVMAFDKDFSLAYGQSLDIEINDIVASPAAGQANLYLHYSNIPGYWDGQFICAVEKGPLVAWGPRVGIGTAEPEGRLNVVGGGGEERGIQFDTGEIKFRGDNNNTTGEMHGHFSIFNGRVLQHLTIDNTGKDKTTGEHNVEEGRTALLSIHTEGNVGVGVDKPQAKLDVAGATRMNFGPAGRLLFGGNTDRNPGIFALDADKLTIRAEAGKELPTIHLDAAEVLVSGRLTLGEDIWRDASVGGTWKRLTRVAYRKDARGNVHLQGALFGGDRGLWTNFFQLEPGYRPPTDPNGAKAVYREASAMRKDWQHATCKLELNVDGWVKIADTGLGEDICVVFFDGITFPAAG